MWPFEQITRFGYRVAGGTASLVGAEDYAEFLRTAGDPEYVAKVYGKSAGKTVEERKEESKEANRYTKRVVEEIAPKVETAVVTTAQALATVSSAGLLGATAVEQGTDALLMAQGEAPTRSLIKMYSPISEQSDFGKIGNFVVDDILGVRGSEHYKHGGLPDDHPYRQTYLASQNTGSVSAPPSMWGNIKSTVTGFFKNFSFGAGSLIGVLLGIAAMFVNPILGVAVLAGGALFGQKLMDAMKPVPASVSPTVPQQQQAPSATTPSGQTRGEDQLGTLTANIPQDTTAVVAR